jgi:hypothetical protein
MYELSVVVDLAREVRVPLVGGLEDYLPKVSDGPRYCDRAGSNADLGAIGELMRCEVDFSKGSFPNQPSKSVVTDRLQIVAREFAGYYVLAELVVTRGTDRTREAPDTSGQAIKCQSHVSSPSSKTASDAVKTANAPLPCAQAQLVLLRPASLRAGSRQAAPRGGKRTIGSCILGDEEETID